MQYPQELEIIHLLRYMFPGVGAWVLARRILWDDFEEGSEARRYAAYMRRRRTHLSIYSVIRRFDARMRRARRH